MLIERRRVNRQKVELKELAEAYLIGSVGDVYSFGKACRVATHFLVAGAGGMAIGIADLCGDDATYLLEEVLGAPEATAGQIDLFHR